MQINDCIHISNSKLSDLFGVSFTCLTRNFVVFYNPAFSMQAYQTLMDDKLIKVAERIQILKDKLSKELSEHMINAVKDIKNVVISELGGAPVGTGELTNLLNVKADKSEVTNNLKVKVNRDEFEETNSKISTIKDQFKHV